MGDGQLVKCGEWRESGGVGFDTLKGGSISFYFVFLLFFIYFSIFMLTY